MYSAFICASCAFSGCLTPEDKKTPKNSVEIPSLSRKRNKTVLNNKTISSTVSNDKSVSLNLRQAEYYVHYGDDSIKCTLCPNACILKDGIRSHCRVREKIGNSLYTHAYANPCAVHVDPIEKKPYYHFLPRTTAFSIATAGCCLRCKFCQNWQISQSPPEETNNVYLPPADVIKNAKEAGAQSIAYTYSEPVIFFEYMKDIAKLAKKSKIRNVVISSGYINTEPLKELCNYIDAIKIDLKGFNPDYYRKICEGELEHVKNAISLAKKEGVWLELVNLVVPTLNDGKKEFIEMSKWVVDTVGVDVPIHFSRFHPNHKLRNIPATPVKTLELARSITMEQGLNYVYVGNVPGHEGEHTYCPSCGKIVIKRYGYHISEYHIDKNGKCTLCNGSIAGVFS